MKLTVNGQERIVGDNPLASLLWVLRDELQLMGTPFGCGMGSCGRCIIQVNGQAVRACITSLAEVAGKEVCTIDALSIMGDGCSPVMHAVNQAFIDEGLDGCTWCASAQIMTVSSLLEKNPLPSSDELREEVAQIYCLCGQNKRIYSMAARVAQEMNRSLAMSSGQGD